MANRTDPHADTVHGGNPQYLVDRIVRVKIYNDAYWKEFCFGLTTESLIDRAAEIDYVGGTYGGRRRPAKFLCLILKLLQINPDEDVIMEYIKQTELKYLRALGCAYLRICGRPMTIINTLEPLLADYRKLRYRDITGKLSIIHMDEFIDWLFREETVCDVTMPAIPKREILEITHDLPPYQSVLEDDLEDLELEHMAELAEKAPAAQETAAEAPAAASSGRKDEAASPSPRERQKGEAASRSPSRRQPRRARSATVSRSPQRSPSRARRERRRASSASRGRASSGSRRRSRSGRRQKGKEKKEKREKKERRDRAREEVEASPKKDVREEEVKESRSKAEKKDKTEKKEKKEKKTKVEKWRVQPAEKKARQEKSSNDLKEEGKPKKDKEESKPQKDKDKDGLSVSEWNQIRKDMGLKPLQG